MVLHLENNASLSQANFVAFCKQRLRPWARNLYQRVVGVVGFVAYTKSGSCVRTSSLHVVNTGLRQSGTALF
jgi:hypothetical protein